MPPRKATLTTAQVVALLHAKGRSIHPDTWRAYVYRHQAPQPVKRIGVSPLWDEAEVTLWQTDREAWKTTYAKVRHRKPKATATQPATTKEPQP